MTITARIVGGGLIAVALCSCGDSAAPLREEVDRQRARIEELEDERAELERKHAADLEALQDALTTRHREELEDVRATLQRTINELSRRMHGLREQLATQTAEPGAPDKNRVPPKDDGPPPAPPISVFQPPQPDLSDFIDPPDDGDLFPVRVSNVRGDQKVIGSVVTSRQVETGETYKDAFGAERPVMRQEAVETKQYDYEVQFEARNRTRNPLTIEFRAGRERRSATLEPGGAQLFTVHSLRGADLTVIAGGERRRYRVAYP